MRMRPIWRAAAIAASATTVLGGTTLASAATGQPGHGGLAGGVRHVLLISADGLHQQDLAWYVRTYPHSVLAALDHQGLEYSNAETPFPSDSAPGMVAQVTGGEAAYEEAIDVNPNALDAGQGLAGLPGSILQMTPNLLQVIDPAKLPVDPKTCKPIYPNQYLQVNTIFNVASDHGLRTAWSDKHPAYQMFSGPSGNGVQDYFTPEINSQALGFPAGDDWTKDNAATMQYDSYKVQAILNEIDGFDHSGKHHLLTHSAAGNNISDKALTVSASGLRAVYAGAAAAAFVGVPASDPRHPDVIGIAQHGVVYTGGTAKIAEHGGDDRQDRNVPILLVLPGVRDGRTFGTPVETTQIAPTILRLLGLNPDELQAVQIERTRVLPG